MTYEVQHWTLCDGWINCWSVDERPQLFATWGQAQAELDEFFADIAAEIKAGTRAPDEGYDRSEFRIVPVRQQGASTPNAERAAHALAAYRSFAGDSTAAPDEDVIDILTDLRHFCERENLSFGNCDGIAHRHHLAERAEETNLSLELPL